MCSAFPTLATTLGASRLRSYTLCRTTMIVSMVWAARCAVGETPMSVNARRRARANRARITRFREEAMPRIYSLVMLLIVREGPTAGADLDFGALPIRCDDGFVGDEFALLGDGFNLPDLAAAGLGGKAGAHRRGQRIPQDLFFDFDHGSGAIEEDIFAVAAAHHLDLNEDLTVLDLPSEAADRGSLALR